jgi:5,10-methylene-tetrahydrofolate dehydrogenase/methenyl tetrahydrofolate cyclohydrolase
MPAKLIDGRSIAALIRAQVSNGVKALTAAGKPVRLVALLVGNNPAAAVYADNFSRLAGIKYKYDRENFFRRNSNIAPEGKDEG